MDAILIFAMFLPVLAALWAAGSAQQRAEDGDPERAKVLRWFAYSLLIMLYLGLLSLALVTYGAGALAQLAPPGSMPDGELGTLLGGDLPARTALALAGPSVLGLVLLLPAARRLFSRFTALEPGNAVHAVALSMSALVVLNLALILAMGIGALAEGLESETALGRQYDPLLPIWIQNACLLAAAFLGVGWLSRRSFAAVRQRLGLVALSLKQAGLGIGVGLLMVPLVLLLEWAAAQLGLAADPDVERLTEQLVGPLTTSAAGIVTLGVGAALGEESVFRGAMQPRFGLLLTAVMFALLHGQYGLSFSTVAVLAIGLLLGWLRRRANTTTAMLAHATYNMALGLIAYLGWLQGF